MTNPALVAYNPSDPEQQAFLAAIRQTESGGNYSIGWGQTDLSGAPVDQYGFPQWSGKMGPSGISHAAGAYQFQPGTWKSVASKYGLNFKNSADQDAGAWYLAEQTYLQKTGGSLDDALNQGKFMDVQTALSKTWTSIKGANIASALQNGAAAQLSPGATPSSGTPSFFSDPLGATSTYFVRGGMILVGVLIALVALWAMLQRSNPLPKLSL